MPQLSIEKWVCHSIMLQYHYSLFSATLNTLDNSPSVGKGEERNENKGKLCLNYNASIGAAAVGKKPHVLGESYVQH